MKFPLLIFPIILASCVTSTTPKGEALPVLGSPARASAWGAPTMNKTSDGYEIVYQNPSNRNERVSIKGSRKLLYGLRYPPHIKGQSSEGGKVVKTATPQGWQKVKIAGQNAYLYQSHYPVDGRAARFKTLGEQLAGPSGTFGHYAVDIEGSNIQMRRWISELRFLQ
jgi:hypothetical protein